MACLLPIFLRISFFFTLLFSLYSLVHSHSPLHLNNLSDQPSLLVFKSAVTYDPHHVFASWNPNQRFCNWTGVTCNLRGERVVSLNLTDMALEGSISPVLSNLSFLQSLDLSNNALHGHIPQQFELLFGLEVLRLHRNRLEGHIPSSLSNCRNLIELALSYNSLSGSIPTDLGFLPHLKLLYLAQNKLTGSIPSSLGNLSALNQFSLSKNRLHGSIPVELGMLTQLRILLIYQNELSSTIPSSFGNLSALNDLELSRNRLHGDIPVELGMLTQLQTLLVFENRLTGEIPSSLSKCTSLANLSLHENQLQGNIPSEFGFKATGLKVLNLWGNQLSGNIPSSLSNCSKLALLFLDHNLLKGTVPMELGKLRLLDRLKLHNNHLVSGSTTNLPFLSALTNCSLLQQIILHDNNFSGVLPLSIGHLSNKLNYFSLGNNNIGGSIPPHIGNLTNLAYLDLHGNLFSGSIPPQFKQLIKLERLMLHSNNLEGNIPEEIGQMKSLGSLNLSHNMLSGRIPDSLCHPQQLRRLHLDNNQFAGNIPASLGKCQTLEMVDLSHNRLNGSILPEVAGLSNLQFYFNLSGNSLQGRLRLEIGKMVMVIEIDISVNQLPSRIPDTVVSCIALQNLNLSQNALEGPIPVFVGNLQKLQEMDLSSNFLLGTIPNSLKRLKMLRYVDFSFNNLTGEVSKEALFSNQSIFASFKGNPDLCGPLVYSLPACPRKQRNHSLLKRVTGSVAVANALLFVCLLIGFIWKWNLQRRRLDISQNVARRPRISYQELCTATNGFNETNLLGVGSFGSVYRGILSDGTTVAVKALDLQNEEAHNSFQRECKVLRRIRHRNLVRVITSCSNNQFKALVLQLVPNGSLEQHLYPSDNEEFCGLGFIDCLNIAIDTAHGIAYLHHECFEQVVHCDIKPSNLLLDDNMTALVTDFGIARLISPNAMQSITSTIALQGSVGYIAPEYGVGVRVSRKGDVYSYGVVLLEMVTRNRPTNNIFMGDMTLPKWVNSAFPNRVAEVADNSLLMDVGREDDQKYRCLVSFVRVGLLCTKDSPEERPFMRNVVSMLEEIREAFSGRAEIFNLKSPSNTISALARSTSTTKRAGGPSDSQSSTI